MLFSSGIYGVLDFQYSKWNFSYNSYYCYKYHSCTYVWILYSGRTEILCATVFMPYFEIHFRSHCKLSNHQRKHYMDKKQKSLKPNFLPLQTYARVPTSERKYIPLTAVEHNLSALGVFPSSLWRNFSECTIGRGRAQIELWGPGLRARLYTAVIPSQEVPTRTRHEPVRTAL